ncbi:MAG: hypothetical protein QXV17_05680 [Candidatus Micrarchaeaceae archaeon]
MLQYKRMNVISLTIRNIGLIQRVQKSPKPDHREYINNTLTRGTIAGRTSCIYRTMEWMQ